MENQKSSVEIIKREDSYYCNTTNGYGGDITVPLLKSGDTIPNICFSRVSFWFFLQKETLQVKWRAGPPNKTAGKQQL